MFVAMILPASSVASADQGEVALGLWAGATLPIEVRGGVVADVGLSDWFWSRTRLGAGVDDHGQTVGTSDTSVLFALDVGRWVPEVGLGAGVRLTDDENLQAFGHALAHVGFRYYLRQRWSFGLSVGGAWRPGYVRGQLLVSLWRHVR